MIAGIGTDIAKVSRFEKWVRNPGMTERFFNPKELSSADSEAARCQHYAARFAAKEAFSKYLNNANLDSRQIYFINQIVEYIVQNGLMKDLSVLQEPPFINQGSIVEIFTDISMWKDILKIIEKVNTNALVA